jgi:hypothetical protein
MRKTFAVAVVTVLLTFARVASASPIWNEGVDAGAFLFTAQTPLGPGPLTNIIGTISNSNDADMYRIYIDDPAGFTAVHSGGSLFDSQLFLFDAAGMGVYANDDAGGFSAVLPNGNPNSPTTPGLYYLVITGYNNDPSSAGGLIFPSTPFNGVFGPTGPGGGSPISGYTNGGGETGTYDITLRGASAVVATPEPATLLLLGSGLAAVAARRRRASKR